MEPLSDRLLRLVDWTGWPYYSNSESFVLISIFLHFDLPRAGCWLTDMIPNETKPIELDAGGWWRGRGPIRSINGSGGWDWEEEEEV